MSKVEKVCLVQLVPLYVCAALPQGGEDWGYLLWTNFGPSWWAGEDAFRRMTEELKKA